MLGAWVDSELDADVDCDFTEMRVTIDGYDIDVAVWDTAGEHDGSNMTERPRRVATTWAVTSHVMGMSPVVILFRVSLSCCVGMEEHSGTLAASYFRGLHGFFIVYDVTNYESFKRIGRLSCS